MPQAVAQRLFEQFGLRYAEGYGLTETAAPSHSNPPDGPKEQCLGMPIFDVDARVVDPATLQELPQGQTCEIMVHGPQVLQGYWKQPDATEQAFVQIDGKRFLHTGEVSEQQMVGWSREHMAAHKSPRIVQFADSLPTSGTGKVMWRALQDAEDAAGT